jgi:hypothetical protein
VLSFCGEVLAQNKSDDRIQIPQVLKINELIEESWKQQQIDPSPSAEEGEWCRRVYLDLLGRIPTVDELREFQSDKSPSKREALVDQLISDDRYVEDFARNWTTIWTNLLIGRTGGADQNSMISRPGMQKFLRDSFARNKPYDAMVYELVTATGTTAPGTAQFNGAVNFLIDKVNDETRKQLRRPREFFGIANSMHPVPQPSVQ